MKKNARKPTRPAVEITIPHSKVLGALGERMDKVDDCFDAMHDKLGEVNAVLQATNAHGNTDVVGWCSHVAERLSGEAMENLKNLDKELTGLFVALQANRERLCPTSEKRGAHSGSAIIEETILKRMVQEQQAALPVAVNQGTGGEKKKSALLAGGAQ